MSLHEVCVTNTLDRAGLSCRCEVGKDRVVRSRIIWSLNVAAARDGLAVCELSTALCDHEVVPAVFLVDMRSLRITSAHTVPYDLRLGQDLTCIRIDLADHDACSCRTCIPALSVLVPEERRVDSAHIYRNWVRPFSGRILCCNDEVAEA